MSKKQDNQNEAGSLANAKAQTRKSRWLTIFVILIAIGIIVIVARKTRDDNSNLQAIDIAGDSTTTAVTQPDLETSIKQLDGKWQRTDGGYILQISQITADGKMESSYFNPNPIHVGRSEWQNRSGKIVIIVELQDVNYPGSLYTLVYIPQENKLVGTYYQAVEKVTYDVEFKKLQ